jgi:hypothetical protein
MVDSFEIDIFEQDSSDFAGTGALRKGIADCRYHLDVLTDDFAFQGSTEHDLHGFLTNPFFDKTNARVAFGPSTSATGDECVNELNRLANYPSERSKAIFEPDAFLTSPRIRNWLTSTRLGTASDKTIGGFFTDNSPSIRKIEAAAKLQGTAPGGANYDYMVFFKRNADTARIVMPQAFGMLPIQRAGFVDTVYAYRRYGGVDTRTPMTAIVAIVRWNG